MENDLIFKTKLSFDSINYIEEADSWSFSFSDKTNIDFIGFWRILKSNKIIFISRDHGRQFGSTNSLDLVNDIMKELKGRTLIEIRVHKDTGDLVLIVTDDIRIEFYTSSIGYESYCLAINGERYIGMGGGSIEIVVPTEDPQVLKSKSLE